MISPGRLQVSAEMKPAFFQLVQHPVQATLTLQEMQVAAGLNNLRASQAAVIANTYKSEVERLFRQDYSHEVDYHTILGGMCLLLLYSYDFDAEAFLFRKMVSSQSCI